MDFDIVSVFPEIFKSFLSGSLIEKAAASKKIKVKVFNLRDYAEDKHRKVDDSPYGGGAGMVLKPEPLFKCLSRRRKKYNEIIYFTPSGEKLNQKMLQDYAEPENKFLIICGRYEGVDQRVIDRFVTREISIGDYVLMGGELPAMVFIEGVSRLLPGVIGNSESSLNESFSLSRKDGARLLEYPQYTRPAVYKGMKTPQVLIEGNHKEIEKWRHGQAYKKTARVRPDLIIKKEEKNEKRSADS